MTPATLLLHDETFDFVHFVAEGEVGHSTLLRATLRTPAQVAHLWAEHIDADASDSTERRLRVYVDDLPEGPFDW